MRNCAHIAYSLSRHRPVNVSELHVAIVGAATSGSAAALLFARSGARVTLLEKVELPRAVGAGIALAANGLAVLESLGFERQFRAAIPVVGMRITDGQGRTLIGVPKPEPRVAMIRRATLQGMLLDAVAREPRIDARFGAEVLAALPSAELFVRVRDATQTVTADLVLGADGARSRVRAGGSFGARVRSGIRYVRAIVNSDRALGEEAWTSAGIFGSFAVDRSASYFFSSCGTPALRAALEHRDVDAYRREWRTAYPASAPLLESLRSWDAMLVNDVVRVDCRRFVDRRLVLLGDAAHSMAPNLGQGANSALVDAAVLLDEIRQAPSLERALAAYDVRRRPAVRRVAMTAARMGALSERTDRLSRALRDRLLLPLVSLLPTQAAMRSLMQEPIERLAVMAAATPGARPSR